MTKNLDNSGLKSVADQYDLFFIDLWGVVHNGIELYQESIDVLEKLSERKKELVLLTNAPRPNYNVVDFLKRMGLEQKFCSKVYTSGEAALNYLTSNFKNKTFFHLGPPRDFALFNNYKKNKKQKISEAEYLLCTGLFDEHDKELSYYKMFLKKEIGKIMICTNPDLIVDRGEKREFCAGSVAKVFEELGGKVEYFGKRTPHFSENTPFFEQIPMPGYSTIPKILHFSTHPLLQILHYSRDTPLFAPIPLPGYSTF